MVTRFQWVQEEGKSSIDATTLKRVRSQAMKDFRRKQRGEQVKLHFKQKQQEAAKKFVWQDDKASSQIVEFQVSPTPPSSDITPPILTPAPELDTRAGSGDEQVESGEVTSISRSLCSPLIWDAKGVPSDRSQSFYRFGSHVVHGIDIDESWLRAMFPRDIWCTPRITRRIASWRKPSAKCMSLTNDAVGLLNAGLTNRDEVLLLEGRKHHVAAVTMLRNTLVEENPSCEGVMASAVCLLICEVFKPVSSQLDRDQLERHLTGLASIVKAQHHQLRRTWFGRYLTTEYSHLDIIHGLVRRQRLILPENMDRTDWASSKPGSIGALFMAVAQLPSLLEATDSTDTSNAGSTQSPIGITRLCLAGLRQTLESWRQEYEATHAMPLALIRQDPDGSLDGTNSSRSEPLTFADYTQGLVLNLYWITQLLLHRCLLDQLSHKDYSISAQGSDSKAQLSSQIDTYAALLCRSMPYLLSCGDGTFCKGLAVRAPLHFVKDWYVASGYDKGTSWCEEMEARLKEELDCLDWDALLPLSYMTLLWLE